MPCKGKTFYFYTQTCKYDPDNKYKVSLHMELSPNKASVLDGVICYKLKNKASPHKRVICLHILVLSRKAFLHNGVILQTTQHACYILTLSLHLLCFMWICVLNTVLLVKGPSTRQLDDSRGGRTCLKEGFKNYCSHRQDIYQVTILSLKLKFA